MTEVRYIEVDADHSGQRLDNFLKTVLKGVPLSRIYRIIRKGEVRINRGRAQPSRRLQVGEVIRIPPIRQAEHADLSKNPLLIRLAQRLESQILFEDDALLVINKPAGIPVHGGSGLQGGVIEALRLHTFTTSYLELAHRLDRQTSGCLVLARSRSTLLDLQQQFGGASHCAVKLYLALLQGHWQGGDRKIYYKLRKNRQLSGERMVTISDSGKSAESLFSPLFCSDIGSLVKIRLLTGRTHQARVHAVACGMPIAGDEKYGNRAFNHQMQHFGLRRLFLHALSISIRHPVSGKSLLVEAPVPVELLDPLTALGMPWDTIKQH